MLSVFCGFQKAQKFLIFFGIYIKLNITCVINKISVFVKIRTEIHSLTAYNIGFFKIGHYRIKRTGACIKQNQQQYKSINGLTDVTNSTAAIGGTDKESDKSLVERLYEFWRQPATSGNVYHYKRWAKEVKGVGEAKIFPLWNGNGTVKVVIASSEIKQCSDEIVKNCAEYIETVRPIGADVTVESAVEKPINISAVLQLSGSRSISEIKADIEKRTEEYLKEIAFKASTLLYNKIGYIILDTEGVIDYISLKINGGSTNIAIKDNELVVRGKFEVTE